MMPDKPNPGPAGGDGGKDLASFLEAANGFVSNVSDLMIKAAGKDEDAVLISGTTEVVIEQFKAVTDRVAEAYEGANAAARIDTDELIALQHGVALVKAGETTARKALLQRVGGGFFAWISQYLTEIKKLIRFIIKAIFGRVPKWYDELETLIDELWDLIVSILGGILGLKRDSIAREQSLRAVNTKNELAALERLQAASDSTTDEDDDY